MGINTYRGDAQPVRQVTHVTPGNIEVGDVFRLTINRKDVEVTATEATADNVLVLMAAAFSARDEAEFDEIEVSIGNDDNGNAAYLVLTGPEDGKPFTVTAGTTEGGLGIEVEETTSGDAGRNEIQRVTLPGVPTGGTFTLTFDGQATGNIAYNASPATIKTALEALSNIAVDDVAVTGNNGGPWSIEFKQVYANTDVALLVGDGTLLTYGAGSKPVRVQLIENGAAGVNERQVIGVAATSGTYTINFGTQTTAAIAYNATAATVQTALEALSNVDPGDVTVTTYQTSINTFSFYVEFKGQYKGTDVPLLILNGASLDGANAVTVTEIQQGATSVPTIVRITPSSSTLYLRLKHPITGVVQTTANLGSNANSVAIYLGQTPGYSAADFRAAPTNVEGLPYFDIEFDGQWAGVPVEIVTDITDPAVENGAIQAVGTVGLEIVQVGGSTSQNAKFSVRTVGALGGTYTLNFLPDTGGAIQTTAGIAYNASAATLKAALEALSNLDTCTVTGSDGGPWVVEFTGAHAAKRAYLSTDASSSTGLTGGSLTAQVTQAAVSGTNERQVISLAGGPAGGTFTLSFSGQTTGNIAYNASAATVLAELVALSNIAPGDLEISGGDGGPWSVVFGGAYRWVDVPLITGDGTNLTGGSVEVSTIQTYQPMTNEVQTVTIEEAQGGTFTLTYGAGTSETIPYNASAAVVEGALERTSTIGVGNVAVSGNAGGPYTIEFTGTLGGTDVALMTASAAGLTGNGSQTFIVSEDVDPTGPDWYDDAENWSLGTVPVTGDEIIFTGAVNCRYGIAGHTAVEPLAIRFYNFSGELGLPTHNGDYYEYRERYLCIGGAGNFPIFVGEGETFSSLIRINAGTAVVDLQVLATGTVSTGDRPAVLLKNVNVASKARVYKGSMGVAFEAGEVSTLAEVNVGFRESQDSDAVCVIGRGVTLPAVKQIGGKAEIGCALSTGLVIEAGAATLLGSGTIALITAEGGRVFYNTSGTLTNATVAGDAVLDFSQDMRTKAVTNPIEVFGDTADINDPFKVANGGGTLVIDYNHTTRHPALGRNFRIERKATA